MKNSIVKTSKENNIEALMGLKSEMDKFIGPLQDFAGDIGQLSELGDSIRSLGKLFEQISEEGDEVIKSLNENVRKGAAKVKEMKAEIASQISAVKDYVSETEEYLAEGVKAVNLMRDFDVDNFIAPTTPAYIGLQGANAVGEYLDGLHPEDTTNYDPGLARGSDVQYRVTLPSGQDKLWVSSGKVFLSRDGTQIVIGTSKSDLPSYIHTQSKFDTPQDKKLVEEARYGGEGLFGKEVEGLEGMSYISKKDLTGDQDLVPVATLDGFAIEVLGAHKIYGVKYPALAYAPLDFCIVEMVTDEGKSAEIKFENGKWVLAYDESLSLSDIVGSPKMRSGNTISSVAIENVVFDTNTIGAGKKKEVLKEYYDSLSGTFLYPKGIKEGSRISRILKLSSAEKDTDKNLRIAADSIISIMALLTEIETKIKDENKQERLEVDDEFDFNSLKAGLFGGKDAKQAMLGFDGDLSLFENAVESIGYFLPVPGVDRNSTIKAVNTEVWLEKVENLYNKLKISKNNEDSTGNNDQGLTDGWKRIVMVVVNLVIVLLLYNIIMAILSPEEGGILEGSFLAAEKITVVMTIGGAAIGYLSKFFSQNTIDGLKKFFEENKKKMLVVSGLVVAATLAASAYNNVISTGGSFDIEFFLASEIDVGIPAFSSFLYSFMDIKSNQGLLEMVLGFGGIAALNAAIDAVKSKMENAFFDAICKATESWATWAFKSFLNKMTVLNPYITKIINKITSWKDRAKESKKYKGATQAIAAAAIKALVTTVKAYDKMKSKDASAGKNKDYTNLRSAGVVMKEGLSYMSYPDASVEERFSELKARVGAPLSKSSYRNNSSLIKLSALYEFLKKNKLEEYKLLIGMF